MTTVTIDSSLKERLPDLILGVARATVVVRDRDPHVVEALEAAAASSQFTTEQIAALPQVDRARRAYKSLGKNPTRYRSSPEALLRRVASGKGLYSVNSLVDVNNVVSLRTRLPVGSYDASQVEFPVTCREGRPGEAYAGIGRGLVDVAAMPLLADAAGAFGSPTSDSTRTKIGVETKDLMMVIFSFSGQHDAENALQIAATMLSKHCDALKVECSIVS